MVRESGEDLSELARSAAAGDRRAAHTLLLKVGPAMLRAARRVLGRRTEDVEDVVQEAMQALVDALPRFKGQCTVPHFAWRVAVLTALANRRRLDLRAQWAAEPTEAPNRGGSPRPGSRRRGPPRGRREALSALLDELPPNQAEVLVLHAAYGFTIEELAGTIGRPSRPSKSPEARQASLARSDRRQPGPRRCPQGDLVSGRRESCPDELLARSSRGVLSLVEQRALDAHLGVCSACRATVALRNLYERLPDLPSDDDRAVVARLAGKVTLGGRQRRDSARPVAFAAGAALMALAGAAAAWMVLQRPPG